MRLDHLLSKDRVSLTAQTYASQEALSRMKTASQVGPGSPVVTLCELVCEVRRMVKVDIAARDSEGSAN